MTQMSTSRPGLHSNMLAVFLIVFNPGRLAVDLHCGRGLNGWERGQPGKGWFHDVVNKKGIIFISS